MSETESPDTEELTALAEALDGSEEELTRLVDRLEDVNQLLDTVSLATDAMDDEMVAGIAKTGGELGGLADAASEPETVDGVESMLHAVGEATGDLEEPPEQVGIVGLLRAMRDPEVQAGVGFLVTVAKHLGADLTRRSELRQDPDYLDAPAAMKAELEERDEERVEEAEATR